MARGPVHFGAPHLVFAAAAVAVSVLFWRSTVKTGCETGLLCKRIFFGLGNGDSFGHTGNGRAGTMPEIDFQSVEFIGDSWSRRRDLNPRPSGYKSFQASMTDCDRGILSLQVRHSCVARASNCDGLVRSVLSSPQRNPHGNRPRPPETGALRPIPTPGTPPMPVAPDGTQVPASRPSARTAV